MVDFIAGLAHTGATNTPTVAVSVVIVGLVALACYDLWKQTVENWSIVALLGVAVGAMSFEHISAQQWLGAVLSALVVFMIYLALGTRGVMGGGDVKLSIVPGLVLGAVSPMLGLWWAASSIVVHQAFFFLVARTPRRAEATSDAAAVALPHVPAMSVAMVLAVTVFPVGI